MSNDDEVRLAEQAAERGRAIVLERLRAAFAHQAAAHGHVVDLDPARLERLVQESAGRAGWALWRRSLAQALTDELGIDLPEALTHPALAQAEALVATPGFMPAPAAMPEPPSWEPEPQAVEDGAPEPDEPEMHFDYGLLEGEPEPEPEWEPEPEPSDAPVPGAADAAQALRLSAVHLNGIETLRQGDRDIELRLSDAGLDVLRRSSGAAIGRLEWSEIQEAEVPAPRRGLRGRRRSRELHVSTERGQAQFELPGLTDEELHDHLEPALARLRGTEQSGLG